MAISKEDKADVKHHMGKALANKVADATRDHSGKLRKEGHGLRDLVAKHGGKVPLAKGGRELREKLNPPGSPVYTGISSQDHKTRKDALYNARNARIGRKNSFEASVPAGVRYKAHGRGLTNK